MKKYLSLLLFIVCTSSAQIPVTDGASIAQQIQQVAAWKKQLEAMSDQFETQQRQFQALTGNRGFGNLYNDPKLRNLLPPEWQQAYANLNRQGLSGLSAEAQELRRQNGAIDSCTHYRGQDRIHCESQSGKNYQDADIFQTALRAANERTAIIANLQDEINNADDPKAIAELQARIGTEQANLQNEMTKMQLSVQLAEIQNRLLQQNGNDELRRRFAQ